MAKWAMAMFIVSAIGTTVGLVGIVFVFRTLKATRKGNKINREIGEAQTRAYLSPGAGTFRVTLNGATLNVTISNFGQSPAQQVDLWARLMMPNMDSTGNHDQLLYSEWRRSGIVGIGAGQDGEAMFLFASGSAPKEIFRGQHANKFYVSAQCRMEWVDVFGKRWPADFFVTEAVKESEPMNALGTPRAGKLRSTQTPTVDQRKS